MPIGLVGTNAWTDGIRSYTQPLAWNAGSQTLSLASGLNGESEFAFFGVPNATPPVTRLTFGIPNGYNAGPGDAIEFALGMPVPEPGVAALFAFGLLVLGARGRYKPLVQG